MKTTLDEWEILQAVVQLGGFAPAAQQLNRSQSTISYAISRLQEQIGIKLFEQKGRRAHLTEAGRELLADVEPHLAGFHQLEQRASSLASGGQSEIRLSVDSIFPNERLFAALAEFARRFPHVHQKLRQTPFTSADSEFSAHNAHLCVVGLMSREYFVKPILDIRMTAIAHCGSSTSLAQTAGLPHRHDATHAGSHRRRGLWQLQAPTAEPSTTIPACKYDRSSGRCGSKRPMFRMATGIPHSSSPGIRGVPAAANAGGGDQRGAP